MPTLSRNAYQLIAKISRGLLNFAPPGKDLIGRNENYWSVSLDEKFPEFILNNKKIYQDWIIEN